jgi:hypothetical protein
MAGQHRLNPPTDFSPIALIPTPHTQYNCSSSQFNANVNPIKT